VLTDWAIVLALRGLLHWLQDEHGIHLHILKSTPRADTGRAIPSISEWAELSRQLQQRRAQLAASNGGASSMSPPALKDSAPSAANGGGGVSQPAAAPLPAPAASVAAVARREQPHRTAKQAARVPGKMTAGAARPHGGVRHTALGSVLRRLRAEASADDAAAAEQQKADSTVV
jgi:hypothetical protein